MTLFISERIFFFQLCIRVVGIDEIAHVHQSSKPVHNIFGRLFRQFSKGSQWGSSRKTIKILPQQHRRTRTKALQMVWTPLGTIVLCF